MNNDDVLQKWDKELDKLLKNEGLEGSPVEVIHQKIKEEFNERLYIGLFGSPGVGKSTLMNKIAGKNIADAGIKPGVEVTEHKWGEEESISFIDLPGFGGLPKEHIIDEYWDKFEVEKLDILICMFETKLTTNDVHFFKKAIENGINVIFVRSKSDSLFDLEKSIEELKSEIKIEYIDNVFGNKHKLLFVSSKTEEGIDDLQKEISNNLSSHLREKFYRNARGYSKSFLEYKKKASLKTVLFYSTISAGANAVPIAGIPIDITNTMKMVQAIAQNFNLSKKRLENFEKVKRDELKNFNLIIGAVYKTGMEVFKQFLIKNSGKEALKRVTGFAPLVGAGIGFSLTYYLGIKSIEDCVVLAEEILDLELSKKYSVV